MKFQPGVSGNPGGRPTKTEEQIAFEEACRKFLWKEGWEILVKMARSHNVRSVQWAIETMLDRAFGRPAQSLEMSIERPEAPQSPEDIKARLDELIESVQERIPGGGSKRPGSEPETKPGEAIQ